MSHQPWLVECKGRLIIRPVNYEAWDRVCALVAQQAPDELQRALAISRLIPWDWTPPEGTPADWKEDRAELARLHEAVKQLGPGAHACLSSAFCNELKSSDVKVAPSDWPRIVVAAATSALAIAERYVKRGRPRAEIKLRLADEIARAYLSLTGETPKTEQPWADDPGDNLYHQLVEGVFTAWGLDGWAHNARQAARRMVARHGARGLKNKAGT